MVASIHLVNGELLKSSIEYEQRHKAVNVTSGSKPNDALLDNIGESKVRMTLLDCI